MTHILSADRSRMVLWGARLLVVGVALCSLVLVTGCATKAPGTTEGEVSSRAGALAEPDHMIVKTKTLHHLSDPAETQPASAESSAAPEGTNGTPQLEAAKDFSSFSTEDYRVEAGDVLDFRSFDDPTLSQAGIVVRFDGFISLPQIPDINVKGKTRTEMIDDVKKAYSGIFKDPQLSITIRQSVSKLYYVMGEVNRPSSYPYTRPMTLLEALNDAGGLRTSTRGGDSYVGAQGQLTKALVIRHRDGQRYVMDFDMRGMNASGPHASDTPIFPGDVVYVPEGVNLVYLFGEARRSGVFALTEGMTMLQLLAQAGGPNFTTARLRHVLLMRQIDAENTDIQLLDVRNMLQGEPDVPLKPGDIVYIPRKRSVKLQEAVTRFTGTVSPLMSLYTQAYDTYYVKKRYDRLFSNQGTTSNTVAALENLRSFGSLLTSEPIATTPTTP